MMKLINKIFLLMFLQILSFVVFAARSETPMNVGYFSDEYLSAKEKFEVAAAQVASSWPRAQIRSFKVPSQSDEDLTVDYLYLPALSQSERLVVVVSGVHGIEGYAGSAIQLMLLTEFGKGLERSRTGYLLVHAMNPYGFKYHRRATESNVNLNRNFSVSGDVYLQANDSYAKIASILEPKGSVVSPLAGSIETSYSLISKILNGDLTVENLTRSIGEGQYQSAAGLEYGGRANEPQTKDLISYLGQVSRVYENIILFDLHTGLGESNQLHIMPGDADRSTDPALFERLFFTQADAGIYKYTPNTSEGFYPTSGDLTNILPQLTSTWQRSVGVTMEFGTLGNGILPKLKTINRLILENEGYHYGYINHSVENKVRQSFDELFYPSNTFWRANVIEKARVTFSRVLSRINQDGTFD